VPGDGSHDQGTENQAPGGHGPWVALLAGPACGHGVNHPGEHGDEDPEIARAHLHDSGSLLPGAEDDHHSQEGREYAAHVAARRPSPLENAGEEEDAEGGQSVEESRMAGSRQFQPPEEGVLVEGNEDDAEDEKPQPLARGEARAWDGPAAEKEEADGGTQGPGQGEGTRVRKAHRRLLAQDISACGEDHMGCHEDASRRASHGL